MARHTFKECFLWGKGECENRLERETGNIYDNSSKIHYSNGDRLKTVKTIELI